MCDTNARCLSDDDGRYRCVCNPGFIGNYVSVMINSTDGFFQFSGSNDFTLRSLLTPFKRKIVYVRELSKKNSTLPC